MKYNEQLPQKPDSNGRREWHMNTSQTRAAMDTTMVKLWTWMAGRFHPQWTNANGDIGGAMFSAWSVELGKMGPDAVERGIKAVDMAGSGYAPNLNKFVSLCRKEDGGGGSCENGSEKFHGKSKPTPDGMPLCWTIGCYTVEELLDSGIQEDVDLANELTRKGFGYWKHKDLERVA